MTESAEAEVTAATVEPGPSRQVSACRHSDHMGARNVSAEACPVYSMVICSSGVTEVARSAPKSGLKGSRGWKSTGPFFTCRQTFGAKAPSSGTNSSYA